MYTFQTFYIPEHMMVALKLYIEYGKEPGSFLTAVICNDLSEACSRADDVNIQNLPAYVAYFYNEAPRGCWGSKEHMQTWMKTQRERRKAHESEPTEVSNNNSKDEPS